MRPLVFISHMEADREVAEWLARMLRRALNGSLEVFVSSDRKSIQSGEQWQTRIEASLKSAKVLLVVCSEESVRRPWINIEIGASWIRGIPIVPVCITGFRKRDLTPPIASFEAADLYEE
ncbi:MAG TPA: toll/interleukin-1 receptor domain-containing protein, partial [bacterium]|nr:toll/interleukin-1 receptor domain-containing protein [bacterium]